MYVVGNSADVRGCSETHFVEISGSLSVFLSINTIGERSELDYLGGSSDLEFGTAPLRKLSIKPGLAILGKSIGIGGRAKPMAFNNLLDVVFCVCYSSADSRLLIDFYVIYRI
jgi:hypothetical protein